MPRDYDKDPVVVEMTVRVFIYEPIEKSEFNSTSEYEDELLLGVVSDHYNVNDCGLDEVTFKTK